MQEPAAKLQKGLSPLAHTRFITSHNLISFDLALGQMARMANWRCLRFMRFSGLGLEMPRAPLFPPSRPRDSLSVSVSVAFPLVVAL